MKSRQYSPIRVPLGTDHTSCDGRGIHQLMTPGNLKHTLYMPLTSSLHIKDVTPKRSPPELQPPLSP